MPAANTYHTLNDYRLSAEPVYENGGWFSKLGAGALIVAIFLGVGAYFFYSTHQRSTDTSPVSNDGSNDTNYQAPAAPDTATPTDTVDQAAMPDAPNAAATSPTSPSTDANAMHSSAQEPAIARTATESKSTVSPAQPAQRAKQSTKSLAKTTRESSPPLTGNAAATTSEMTEPAPTISPQPATANHATDTVQDPIATKSEAPTDAAPDAAIDRSFGG